MPRKFMTTSRAALIALLAAGPVAAPMAAFAQTDGADAPMTAPADSTMNADSSTLPADDSSTGMMGAGGGDGADMAADAEPAKPVEGQIAIQGQDTILADNLIGATVFNGADETVGSIDDLIIAMDGNVEGVVIGVGGFLGMGEKHVAVEMASLDMLNDGSGNPRLVTSATRADLEAAPEFVSAESRQQEADDAAIQSGAGGPETVPVQ